MLIFIVLLQVDPFNHIAPNSIKNASYDNIEKYIKTNNLDSSNFVQQFGYVTMYPLAKFILNIT